jgi:hypothetical protein
MSIMTLFNTKWILFKCKMRSSTLFAGPNLSSFFFFFYGTSAHFQAIASLIFCLQPSLLLASFFSHEDLFFQKLDKICDCMCYIMYKMRLSIEMRVIEIRAVLLV